MSKCIPVVAVAGGSTIVVGSSDDYLWQNDRIHVVRTSDALRAQSDRINLHRLAPMPTPPGNVQPEYVDAIHEGIEFRLTSSGVEKFKNSAVDHQYLRDQIPDDIVVVVVDPFQHFSQAVHSVRAQAYFLQECLGFSASEAVCEALKLHFRAGPEDILQQSPRLSALLDDMSGAEWDCVIAASDPWLRYPLMRGKANVEEFQRELDGFILARTRKSDRTRDLLRQVLRTVRRVIITFARYDWLSSLPGVHFDPIALANELAPPRPGVSIVVGKYVDHRLDRVGDRVEHFEGFCQDAPSQLWNVLRNALDETPTPPFARILPRKDWKWRLSPYAITAISLPILLIVVILTTLTSWQFAIIMMSVLAVIGAEAVCLHEILRTRKKEHAPAPVAREQQKPAQQPARPDKDIAKALADRGNPMNLNGHAEPAQK